MLHVTEYFPKSLKVTRNDTVNSTTTYAIYVVPFLRYSASNNGVTLKSGLRVVQGD